MRNHFESIDQVNTLREIQALRRLSPHPHIITLEEVLYDQPTGRLALVFELMDQNLYEVIRGRRHYLSPQLIKIYIFQLLKGLEHMHRKGIFHRDIKVRFLVQPIRASLPTPPFGFQCCSSLTHPHPTHIPTHHPQPENILVNHNCDFEKGLKLADFGSCRGIYSKQPYTEYISTRWYRAPECLLTDGYYGAEMDLWGVGCVFFEITSLYPLFPGTNELDQINRVHQILGTPTEKVMRKFKEKGAAHLDFNYPTLKATGIAKLIPHAPPDAVDVMQKLLAYDPDDRISAKEALRHNWFADLVKMEQNLKRRNRGASSRNKVSSSPSPVPSVGKSSRRSKKSSSLKPSQSTDTIKSDSGKNKKSSKNDSGNPEVDSSDNTGDNGKTTGSLPSIAPGGGSSTSRAQGGDGGRPGDSPLPPIVGGDNSSSSSNNNSNSKSSSSKVGGSYSNSSLRSKDPGGSSYGSSSVYRHRRSKKDKSRSSKHGSSKNRRSHHSKKNYGAYGASVYKSSSTSRSHGSSKYQSGGSSASFSVLGHGHKGGSGRSKYGQSSGRSKGYTMPSKRR